MSDKGPASSAALVSSLAQQLRSGAISKHQLFEKLASLQRAGPHDGTKPDTAPPSTTLDETQQQALADRLARQRLANESTRQETHGQQQQQQREAWSAAQPRRDSEEDSLGRAEGSIPAEQPPEEFASEQAASVQLAYVRAHAGDNESPDHHSQEVSSPTSNSRQLGFATSTSSAAQEHTHLPAEARRVSARGPRYSLDTTSTSRRSRPQDRLEQLEAELEEKEMAECTFRPKINDLPAQYKKKAVAKAGRGRRASAAAAGNHDYTAMPFLDRVSRWQESRNKLTAAQRAEQEVKELDGCTFQPNVRVSERIEKRLERRRRRASAGVVHEAAAGDDSGLGKGQAASERLYEYSKQRQERLNESRATAMSTQGQEIDEHCTFKPRIREFKTEDGQSIEPRYQTPKSAPTPKDSNVTFTPKVNKVPKYMGAAKTYLREDPFERLSRPNMFSPMHTEGIDESPFGQGARGSVDSAVTDEVFATPHKHSDRPSTAPGSCGHKHKHNLPGPPKNRSTAHGFNAFLERQNRSSRRKEETQQRIVADKKAKAPYKPKISKTSKAITAHSGSFLERLEKQARQKENLKKFQEQEKNALDSECTFKPKINRMSKHMGHRTDEQRSVGDAQKRQQVVSALKARQEHSELQEATFKPKLVTNNHGVRGKVRPDEDTHVYLQRLRQEENQLEAKRRYLQAQKEAEELEDCTFQPEIHDAPEYVKRIARSMQLARGPQQPPEPERRWL